MNRHMQQIDHQTGEVVEGFVAYVVPKRKNGFQKGWMAMAQAMMMLAQSNLTGNDDGYVGNACPVTMKTWPK